VPNTLMNLLVGFTGTRKGMTQYQKDTLAALWAEHPAELHLGDAIGADAEAFDLAAATNHVHEWKRPIVLVGYPSDRPDQRAFKHYDMTHGALPPMERNRLIVERTDLLVGCPHSMRELETGTWKTIIFAWGKKPVWIVRPDGNIERM